MEDNIHAEVDRVIRDLERQETQAHAPAQPRRFEIDSTATALIIAIVIFGVIWVVKWIGGEAIADLFILGMIWLCLAVAMNEKGPSDG